MTLTNSKRLILAFIIIIFLSLITTTIISADSPEVYVDDDFNELTPGWNVTHFNDIQSGIDNLEENGTLYIYNGNYLGDILVNKSSTITGENVDEVIVSGQFLVESNNTIIEQLTIRDVSGGDFPSAILDMSSDSTYRNLKLINNTYGIQFSEYSLNTLVENNLLENNSDGVHSYNTAPHAVITNNNFNNNVENALYIVDSDYFTIASNYIINTAETGLTLSSSSNNLIYNNYFDNSFNHYVNGGTNNSFNVSKTPGTNIIGGDYIGGNYWNDYIGIDLNGDGLGNTSYILSVGLSYDYNPLVFTRFYVDDDADSSWYDKTHVHTISEAVDNASSIGAIISVFNGTYNEYVYVDKTVSIIGERTEGVYVTNDEDDNTFYIGGPGVMLSHMTIGDNHGSEGSSAGIYDYTANAIYTDLHILNNDYGIYLSSGSSYTAIQDCVIENNSDAGIYLLYSYNTLILNNFIIDNTIGIMHQDATQDLIYNNYFDNTQNVNITIEESTYNTSWNIIKTLGENIIGGPYIAGNYWSDYTGIDTNSDGIGETNYSLGTSGAYDYMPLTSVNYPPLIGTPNPSNGSSNQPLSLDWSVQITDYDGVFDWFISCSNGQNDQYYGDTNGTKTIELSNLAYGTSYTVFVNVYDYYQWTNETFYFVTKNKPAPPPKPEPNEKPVAIIDGDLSGFPGENLQFDGSASYDPDGEIYSYLWDFHEGTIIQGETASHSYRNKGIYTVSLTVTDNKGQTDSTSTKVTIIKPNYPPEINIDANNLPGELTISLTASVNDEDGDPVSCFINWNDGSTPTAFEANNDQHTFKHTFATYGNYTISATADDGSVESSASTYISILDIQSDIPEIFEGFSQIAKNNDSFIDNQIQNRSVFGNFVKKDYVIPLATATSIILLFLLNILIEFLSDYTSEHIIDRKKEKEKTTKKAKSKKLSVFLSNKEIFAVFVSSVVLALVLTWTWAPDLSVFWETFFIILAIELAIIFLKEGLRSYLSYKKEVHSEYYIWPLGIGMMFVSTFLGNTFSLGANHHYDDEADIKKCGKVNFIVSLVLYAILLTVFITNLYYPSAILQMITIVAVLNLFIDLFPFSPMDGHEVRHWNFLLWAVLYAIVTLSYIVVYFNIFP